ncbi:hypothetical protein NUW54_g18 [Trametes sanguinea]|uniref:Uncharacterized protein n=2 Tax=Trametes sanguinea TaxID=158606 RepID=A0ACC1QAD6_9APHY|nr:hypothetical protein NUW54_g141 [Trametes sanguinea]KAJ3019652.1 hypothetical protein NUW54_g18 [Trametes sanguinea]
MGKNYQDWKFAIQIVMHRAGCLTIATGKNSEKPATYQYNYIQNAKTGLEAWSALQEAYNKNMYANCITLKRKFYTPAHNPNALIHENTNHITNLVECLKSISVTLSDDDIIDVLIINLRPQLSVYHQLALDTADTQAHRSC